MSNNFHLTLSWKKWGKWCMMHLWQRGELMDAENSSLWVFMSTTKTERDQLSPSLFKTAAGKTIQRQKRCKSFKSSSFWQPDTLQVSIVEHFSQILLAKVNKHAFQLSRRVELNVPGSHACYIKEEWRQTAIKPIEDRSRSSHAHCYFHVHKLSQKMQHCETLKACTH